MSPADIVGAGVNLMSFGTYQDHAERSPPARTTRAQQRTPTTATTITTTGANREQRASAGLYALIDLVVVPVTVITGLLCLIKPASRPFSKALLLGSGIATVIFAIACRLLTAT